MCGTHREQELLVLVDQHLACVRAQASTVAHEPAHGSVVAPVLPTVRLGVGGGRGGGVGWGGTCERG